LEKLKKDERERSSGSMIVDREKLYMAFWLSIEDRAPGGWGHWFTVFPKLMKDFWSKGKRFSADYNFMLCQTPENMENIFHKSFYGETNGAYDSKIVSNCKLQQVEPHVLIEMIQHNRVKPIYSAGVHHPL
jgi:hypothetical protein